MSKEICVMMIVSLIIGFIAIGGGRRPLMR